jgi:hypothetical protein
LGSATVWVPASTASASAAAVLVGAIVMSQR